MGPILIRAAAVLAACVAAGCAQIPMQPPVPVETRGPAGGPSAPAPLPPPPPAIAGRTEPRAEPAAPRVEPPARTRARWSPTRHADLPGWSDDRSAEIWPALMAGCARPQPGWNELCARALLEAPSGHVDVRRWLEAHLMPYRIEAADAPTATEGLLTGYFEPTLDASRRPRSGFRVPLYAPPSDLALRRPYYTRQQLDTLPAAQAALRGQEIAWIEDPLDALLVQVQGSGRLRLADGDGGRSTTVRVAFAAHNDQPYRSLGRWLIEQGELAVDAVSWPAIKAWAQRHPKRLQELLWANPRVVFFREEPLPDPAVGPRGALGVPLTPGRSVAVDPAAVPLGAMVWLDTTEPLSTQPMQRLVMAQDSGGAIIGAVRADFFWGWTKEAETQAGRTRQPLRLWVLWPRGAALPPQAQGTTPAPQP